MVHYQNYHKSSSVQVQYKCEGYLDYALSSLRFQYLLVYAVIVREANPIHEQVRNPKRSLTKKEKISLTPQILFTCVFLQQTPSNPQGRGGCNPQC